MMLELFTAKTFTIIALQLSISWLVGYLVVLYLRKLLSNNQWNAVTDVGKDGIIDLHIDLERIKIPILSILIIAVGSFAALFFIDARNMNLAVPLLLTCSIFTALFFVICFINFDENFTNRLSGVLALSSFLLALKSYYAIEGLSTIQSSMIILFAALSLISIIILLIKMNSYTQRLGSILLSTIFLLYIYFDFTNLVENIRYYDDWSIAITYCINIYLDFISFLFDIFMAIAEATE